MAHDVFISYSSRDQGVAAAVCSALEARGIPCWIASRDIPPGSRANPAITAAIDVSRLLVMVCSPAGGASGPIQNEVQRAMDLAIPVLPFRVEEGPQPNWMPRGYPWHDGSRPDLERHLKHLGGAVHGLLRQPSGRGGTGNGARALSEAAQLDVRAQALAAADDYEAAEDHYARALAIRERVLGLEHPDTAQSLHRLAWFNYDRGNYRRAELFCRRALAIRQKVLGSEHPDVAVSLSCLAWLRYDQGRFQEAESLYLRALAAREKSLGPDDPATAMSLNDLATLYRDLERHAEAEPLFRRALEIQQRALGPEDPVTALSLDTLATFYRDRGCYRQAEPLFRQALDVFERTLGPEHLETGTSLMHYAMLLCATDREDEAEQIEERARAIWARHGLWVPEG